MINRLKNRIKKIPIVTGSIGFLQKIEFSTLGNISLYELLKVYLNSIIKGDLTQRASAIAFSFFMALFPFMLFILNLMPYIPIEGYQEDFLQFVNENVPPNTFSAIEEIILDITKKSNGNLISFGFLLTIYLMSNGVNSLLSGFELSENISVKRPFLRQYVVAICLSLVIAFVLLLSVAMLIYVEVIIVKIESRVEVTKSIALLEIAKYLFLVSMVYILFITLYKMGTKETKKLSFWNAGTILTTLLFILSSYLFGIYVEKFAKYNELYGSIGTLLVIMFYIWINCMLLLIGFELNAFIFKLKNKN